MKTISYFSVLSSIESLKKDDTGQYVKVPDWMKVAKNSKEPLTSTQRAQAERTLNGPGKISPSDLNDIINTRNLDLMTFFAKRGDLSVDNARRILDHDEGFNGTYHVYGPGNLDKFKKLHPKEELSANEKVSVGGFTSGYNDTRTTNKKNEVYYNLIKKIKMSGQDNLEDFLKHGSEDAVGWYLKGRNTESSPADLFHVITERPKIGHAMMKDIAYNRNFDNGHLTEVMNRPESDLKEIALANSNEAPSDAILGNVFRSGDPKIIKGALDNSKTSFSPEQWSLLLHSKDEDLRGSAHRKFAQNDHPVGDPNNAEKWQLLAGDIINNSNPSDLKEYLNHFYRYGFDRDPHKIFTPHQSEQLLKRLELHPEAMVSGALGITGVNDALTPAHKNNLINAVANSLTDEDKTSWSDSDKTSTVNRIFDGDNSAAHITPETISNVLSKDPQWHNRLWPSILNHPSANEDHFRKIYGDATETGLKNFNNSIDLLASNPKTPADVIQSLISTQDIKSLPRNVKMGLVEGEKLPRNVWEQLAYGEDPYLRSCAATSPNVTDADISRALADPDKDVRRAWIQNVSDGKLNDSHWDMISKDRSIVNRATALGRMNVPDNVLTKFMTKDKAIGVNRAAFAHPYVTDEMRNAALKSMNPHNLALVAPKDVFTEDQNKVLYKRLVEDRVVKLAKLNKQAKDNKITPEALQSGIDATNSAYQVSLSELSNHHHLPSEVVHGILSLPQRMFSLTNNIRNMRQNDQMRPEHWEALLDRKDLDDTTVNHVLSNAQVSGDRWRSIASKLDPSNPTGQESWHKLLASNPNVPDDIVDDFIDRGGPQFSRSFLSSRAPESVSSDRIRKIYANTPKDLAEDESSGNWGTLVTLSQHSSLPADVIPDFYDKMLNSRGKYDGALIRRELLDHPNVPESVITRALKDPDQAVSNLAMDKVGQSDPDKINGAIGGHDTYVHPAVEKLKDLKGQVSDLGGGNPVPKGKLPHKGQGLPNDLFDAKGQISAQSIDEFIDKLPKDRYNVSYTKWNGAQRHDTSKPQLVMQINLTNKHIDDLNREGLLDVFKRVHAAGFASGHPVRKHSLGWARLDVSQPGHAHVDEVQSDLWQNSIHQIEKYAKSGQISRETANEHIGAIKKINKILSGQFKNINQAVTAAVHQVLRVHPKELKSPDGEDLQPIKTTSFDMPEDQAIQSGMTTKVNVTPKMVKNFYDGSLRSDSWEHRALNGWAAQNKVLDNPEIGIDKFKEMHGGKGAYLDVPTPGFFKEKYQQLPESMGYKPVEKKTVMPDNQSPESQVQYRKLVKSLTKLQNLVKMLKSLKEIK